MSDRSMRCRHFPCSVQQLLLFSDLTALCLWCLFRPTEVGARGKMEKLCCILFRPFLSQHSSVLSEMGQCHFCVVKPTNHGKMVNCLNKRLIEHSGHGSLDAQEPELRGACGGWRLSSGCLKTMHIIFVSSISHVCCRSVLYISSLQLVFFMIRNWSEPEFVH